jgi:hypothetical protein
MALVIVGVESVCRGALDTPVLCCQAIGPQYATVKRGGL